MRKEQHECFASEERFRKDPTEACGHNESAEFFRGYAFSAMHSADDLLSEARAIESTRKARKK
jgi:hypothetical protein